MDLNFHTRYIMEHKILPGIFYDEGPRLLRKFMLDGGKVMSEYYDRIARANPGYKSLYTESDFYVFFRTYIKDAETCMVLRVEMPVPERALLCRAIYLCYGTRGGCDLYITSELTAEGGHCICGWSDSGHHMNFGNAPTDRNDEMDMAADLFWQSVEYRMAG